MRRTLISSMMLCWVVVASQFVLANDQPAETPLSQVQAQAAGRAAAANIPSVSDLLERYTEALDSTLSFIDHYELIRQFSSRVLTSQKYEGEIFIHGQHRHDEQRVYHQKYTSGDFPDTKMPKESPYYHISIRDDRKGMTYQNHGRPKTFGTKALGTHTGRPFKKNLSRDYGVSFIAGYISSDERLDRILRKADAISVREATENIRGSECFVLDADTKYGQYTVWLDPQHGYHPSRVRHRSGEGDHWYSLTNPKGYTGFTYLDAVRFERVDGIWVPMEADGGHDRRFADGRYEKSDMHYKRTKIILNPDHDRLGSFADPLLEDPSNDPELVNGTTVFLEDDANTKYTWQDGRLIDGNGREVDLDK